MVLDVELTDMSFVDRRSFSWIALLAGLSLPSLYADTVYLKNGAWIDGRVQSRSDKLVEVQIGKIGKMEIKAEEVYAIEKNSRWGDEAEPDPQAAVPAGSGPQQREDPRPSSAQRPGPAPSADPAGSGSAQEVSPQLTGLSEQGTPEPQAPPGGGAGPGTEATRGGQHPTPPQTPDTQTIDPQLKSQIQQSVQDLQRNKVQYRTRAERQLKAVGTPCVPFLLPLAKNESELVRIAVFRIFYDVGDDGAVEACLGGLVDSSEFVRDYANKTLKRVTKQDFGFESQASPRRREAACSKWQKWWEAEKERREKERRIAEQGKKS